MNTMKKLFTLGIGLCLAGGAFAQTLPAIPNGDFEAWTTSTNGRYMDANNWDSYNASTDTAQTYTTEKGTTGAPSGQAFLKLTTKTITGFNNPVYGAAIAYTGNRYGFPCTARPAYLLFSAQAKAGSTSSVGKRNEIRFYLTKWNPASNRRDTVGHFRGAINETASFTAFTAPISYYSTATPDTCRITLFSGLSANDHLYIDNLRFANATNGTQLTNVPLGLVNAPTAVSFTLYPNPAPAGQATLTFEQPLPAHTTLAITDMTGHTLRITELPAGATQTTVNTANLAPGLYIVRTLGQGQVGARQLIVQ